MTARAGLALACVAIVVALRVADAPPEGIPFVNVVQGTTAYEVGGERIFVRREGSIVTAFLGRSTGDGELLVYCIEEEAFVAPLETSMWTARGEFVAGPSPRDLDRVRATVDDRGLLVIDPSDVTRATGRGTGEVSGETGERYQAYRDGDTTAGFCVRHFPAAAATPAPPGSSLTGR